MKQILLVCALGWSTAGCGVVDSTPPAAEDEEVLSVDESSLSSCRSCCTLYWIQIYKKPDGFMRLQKRDSCGTPICEWYGYYQRGLRPWCMEFTACGSSCTG